MQTRNVVIRTLTRLEELGEVEDIQRAVWPDPTVIVYRNTLLNLVRNGGLVLGAVDVESEHIVGFLLSYLGIESPEADRPAMANLKLVSQRMAILPEYRDGGIGYDLKLAQRNYAIKQGIRLITWTFDPLLTRNAHLNIRKLGAIVREYWRDFYGNTPSPQVVLGSSDRFVAEWWVTGNRVEQRLSGKRGALTLEHYVGSAAILNASRESSAGFALPGNRIQPPQGMVALVEVPENYQKMIDDDPQLAREWRFHTREMFEQSLAAGYTITDFVRGTYENRLRSFYAITIADAPLGGFSSN
jgi:predicted GNAT superfamily acetyltransferase